MSEREKIFFYREAGNDRLDVYLTRCMPEFSRSRIQIFIKDGNVSVDDSLITKTGYTLENNTKISVHVPKKETGIIQSESVSLDIVFENDDLVVINKPAGMVVHPAPGHSSGTLVNAILGYIPGIEGIGGQERPGIVHRLDKNTSGIIIIAKNDRAHRWLQDQFKSRRVDKKYLALVDGKPPTPAGKIDAPIGRSSSHRKLMAVVPPGKGRDAVSEYSTLEMFPNHTYLEIHPRTGRTHQIRVHLAYIGCPIAGDTIYGRKKPSIPLDGQFLHAGEITINLPGETKSTTFHAALPENLLAILKELRGALNR